VRKRKASGVEELARESDSRPGGSPAVQRIANHRVADRLHVHPDLVSPPRLQAHPQQGQPSGQQLLDLEVGPRVADVIAVE
jgi:hypothetical protein